VIEGMIRPTPTRGLPIWRALLALLVVGGILLLALSSGPAVAAITLTVNSTDDQGEPAAMQGDGRCDWDASTAGRQCTLRAAIEEANGISGADTIEFNIGGTDALKTISPSSALPTITDTLTIDGFTQSGASPNTLAGGNDAVLNVQLDGRNAGSGVDGLRIEAADSTIKGLVIRRFDDNGVRIIGAGATGNKVEGNFIGVNRNGTTAQVNAQTGVHIESDSNTVGSTQPDSRNVISGNGGDGVVISGGNENRIEGNYIGTTADGSGDVGNTQDGVFIDNGADLTAVGGTPSGACNRIAHNGGDGVAIAHNNFDSAVGNHVLSNSIFDNGGLGIDLLGNTTDLTTGVSGNDKDDTDAGPNNLQNFPVIRSITRSSAIPRTTTISGTLNSTPSTAPLAQDFVVQCFLTDGAPASAHGEGSVLLDSVITSTNVNGNARFSCVSSRPLLGQVPGQTVSATATSIVTGDTSEFSRNKAITTGP
jgi:hypothetical protein